MRVLRILTRPNLGGPTRQAIALWHAHREQGVATLLVTGAVDPTETALSPAAHGVPRLSFVEVVQTGGESFPTGWVEVDALTRGIAPFSDRRATRALERLIRAVRPDVVHTHTSKAGALGRRAAVWSGDAVRPTVVHTFHGHVLRDYFSWPFAELLRRGERRRARATTHLVAVSPSCADELAELGIAARERITVVPPAVAVPEPLTREAARRALDIPQDEFRLVTVGRCVPVKRQSDFIAAIASASTLRGDVVGSGPLLAGLRRQAAAVAPDRLTFRGAVPAIAEHLAAYDALVLPSRREGCPLVVIEAFAAGVPVIGYDVPGVRDVLATWGRGALVPGAKGPAGLAAAAQELRSSPALRAEYVAAGHAATGQFAPAAVAARLTAIYAQK